MRPDGLPRHKCHGRDVEGDVVETERTLHEIHKNLVRLTHQVPMVAIEDLPKEIQRRMAGVPRDWVRLF